LQIQIDGQKTTDEEQLEQNGVQTTGFEAFVSRQGVSVAFDGETAKIQVASLYKNVQCGLCGHYNDEQEDVFRMSGGQLSSDLKQFHRSYALQNEECSSGQLNSFYDEQKSEEFGVRTSGYMSNKKQQQQSQEQKGWAGNALDSMFGSSSSSSEGSSSSEEQNNEEQQYGGQKNIKPVDQTAVIEYSGKICFSTEPVKRCPRYTQTDDESSQSKPKKVPFFCLDRHSVEARRMQRQARAGQQVDATAYTPAFVETLEQPTKCIAAY